MRKPLAVIFDIGGTLLHLESANAIEGNLRLLEYAKPPVDITAEELTELVNEYYESTFGVADRENIQIRIPEFYRLLFETLGLSFSIGYSDMGKLFWNTAMKYIPNDGIYDVLHKLDEYGIEKGVITNSGFSGEIMLGELEKHDMAHRFSFLISSSDYGIRKPDKRIFDVAIKKTGLKPEDIWFVGDKADYDVRGAINAGLFPVLYNWRNESPVIEAEHLILNNWYEFRDKIELLFSS